MCRALCSQTFANASVDWVLPPWSEQDEVRDALLQACFALNRLLGFWLALCSIVSCASWLAPLYHVHAWHNLPAVTHHAALS